MKLYSSLSLSLSLSLSYLDTPCSSVVSCAGSVNIYPCDKTRGLVLDRCLCGWNSAKPGGWELGFALVEEEEEEEEEEERSSMFLWLGGFCAE